MSENQVDVEYCLNEYKIGQLSFHKSWYVYIYPALFVELDIIL